MHMVKMHNNTQVLFFFFFFLEKIDHELFIKKALSLCQKIQIAEHYYEYPPSTLVVHTSFLLILQAYQLLCYPCALCVSKMLVSTWLKVSVLPLLCAQKLSNRASLL